MFKLFFTLLKLNLPEFFNILNKLQILNICIRVKPAFVLISGKIINTKGRENMNLPAYAITSARIIDKIIVKVLILFEIFALEVFTNQLSTK